MATPDRLEREAQRSNPWPYIDKALADERAKQPINLQPGEDFRGDALIDNRALDVADSKRQLNAAAMRADERQTQAAQSGIDMTAYYQEYNAYSAGQDFLDKSALMSERESKLRKPGDVRDFDMLAQAIEDARAAGMEVSVDDVNNSVDWHRANLAADKLVRLSLDGVDKNQLAIENVYKTLEQQDVQLASIVPMIAQEKLRDLATDPTIVEQGVGIALQGLDKLLTPFIVANENVMQSVRGGLLQAQEASQGGNGQLGVMGAFLGGTVTRRDDVEEGDFNEKYIQSIREATDEQGQPLYSQLEVDIAVELSRLKATDPSASPWDIFVNYATNNEAKAILGSMVSGNGPRALAHAELLRQVDSAHLGNTGQMLFGAGVDEVFNPSRGGETRQDLANILGFGSSVVLDPTIVGTKVYRGVQGARYMLANLAPVADGAVGARSILTKGKGFGPFRLNNKTYRFFDQLAKDLNKYDEVLKKVDELAEGDAKVQARVDADAMRQRIERQYGQIPDSTISDIFATVPRTDGKITVDNIADYIDETNADYLTSYVALENEALRLGYTMNEVPRFVADVLDQQGIKSFDQMVSGAGQLKRGDLTPQMTSLGVLRKSVANRVAAEMMPTKKALKILQDFVDVTDAGTVAQSMSDNALEIGEQAQNFKRGTREGFFDSTRRMFSSIAIDNRVDLADPDAAKQVYRYTRTFLPQKMSEVVSNAWRNGDTGSRRLLMSAVVRAAAMSRGLTVTKTQADSWMGRVEELVDMTGKKPNEAYGQRVKNKDLPSRLLAQAQSRGVQSQGVGGIDNTRIPAAADDVSVIDEAGVLSRPIDAVAPVITRGPSIKSRSEKQDEILERLGATEDDIAEGRISYEDAARIEEQLLDEYRGQVLDDLTLRDEFLATLGFGQDAGTIGRTDWWLDPVPGQSMLNGPSMPADLGAAAGSTKRLQADGTISRQNLADIADAYGDEKAIAWLYTGYLENYLDDSLNIPVTVARKTDANGNAIAGWRGLPDEWYQEFMVKTGKEYRIAVPWARGGNKGRRSAEQEDLDYQFEVYRDQAIEDIRAGAYDRELDEFIIANREVSRDVRWEPVPAREPVFNPAIREPEPQPFRITAEGDEGEKMYSLSSDARGVESALHIDQTSRYVRIPNLSEMEELRKDMGPLGKAMYGGHKGLEWYTNFWSIATLFGWRFSIRNAIEELGLWFLTAGSVSALAKGRLMDTSIRRQTPDLFFKEIKHGRGKGEVKVVWKQNLGPVNRQIERGRRVVARVAKRPEGETLATWQREWAEAKGMPGYFMRNVFLPVVAPRVNTEAMQSALLKAAQGDREPLGKLVIEGLVGYQLGGRPLASFGLIDDDDLDIFTHFLYSSHAEALRNEVLQSGVFINSARNPSARAYANGLDDIDDIPPGVLVGTLDEERALESLKRLGDKVGVKIDGFDMQAVSSRRKLDDWHHLIRAIAQGDGPIGDAAIQGLFDISYGRATSIQVKANVAQAIRNDPTGDYVARYSRLSTEEGVDQFASDYFEDVLAIFQRGDGSINTRLLDRFFDREGKYLGWGRPMPSLDEGVLYEDRLSVADLAAIPPKERPAMLMLPNRSEREYIPFAGTLPSIITGDRAYGWMGRQNGRLSRGPVFLANMITLWKASRNRREQMSRALASARGRNYEELAPETQKYLNSAAGAIVSKTVFDDAYNMSLAFMDNPNNRSNLAWKARNFSRYYRASEDFYRRMRRMAIANPEGYVKAALAYNLVEDSGFVFTDDYGDKYFIYPLNGVAQGTTQFMLRKVFGMDAAPEFFETQPFSIGGKLLGLTPSADTMNLAPPVTSGWGQTPAAFIFNRVPQFAGARALTLGQYNQPTGNVMGDLLNAFLPASARRLSAVQDPELLEGQIGDAQTKAVQIMTGWGMFDQITIRDGDKVTKIPIDEATEDQIFASEEMRAADVFGLGLWIDKMIGSLTLPAFPQTIENNVSEFARGMNTDSMSDGYYDWMDKIAYDEEYVKLLEQAIGQEIFDPESYAKAEWWMLKVNRIVDGDDASDGGSFLPYMVGSFEDADDPAAQRSNIRATAETLDWFNSNEGYQKYPADLRGAALFLAPREGEWDANGHYVIKNLLKTRVKKSDDDKIREIMNIELSAQMGRTKFKYDKQRHTLDPYAPDYADRLREINRSEEAERKEIRETNKRSSFMTFELNRGTAFEVAEDVRRLIAFEREQSPDGKISGTDVGWLASALMAYDEAELRLAQFPRNTNRDRAERNQIMADRDAQYRNLMGINEKVRNFIESVVIPMGE